MSENLNTPPNSIWPNGFKIDDQGYVVYQPLGTNRVSIPDGINETWPIGDALVGNFVYNDEKLVGFVDTHALEINESKSTYFPYDTVQIELPSIIKDSITITAGDNCKKLEVKCLDVDSEIKFLLGDETFNTEYIKDENKLVIHTDRIKEEKVEELNTLLEKILPKNLTVERYNHHLEVSWRDLNRYADCKNYDEMNAVAQTYGFSSFKDDLTSDGWWIYPMSSIYGTSLNIQYFFGHYDPALASKVIRGARIILPENTKYEASASFMAHCTNLEEVYLYAPTMLNNSSAFANDCPKLTKAEVYVPIIRNLNSWCAGCKSLSHFRFLTPLKNQLLYSQNAWKDCVLDVESVQNIAENLPTMTTLTTTTIGIDAAFQNDEAISEALSLLDSKNWNIELQTNQSPTSTASSTYSLRGKTIYAKVVEIDGEMELCWGHYVTHPEGYQEFSSLEDAYAHFGLEQK